MAPKYSRTEIRRHSNAAASAPAALRSLRRITCRYTSAARLAGAAHRRSRCVAVFPTGSTKAITITPVGSRRDLGEFIELPFRLYKGDPSWVPPLRSERREFLDPRRNPFFAHADVALWLARRAGRVIGRISSQVDHTHNATHGERTAMFGFFESESDPDVAAALLERASLWARERGARTLRGPMSFSLNHEAGLLVEGFHGPPVFMMPHNPPHYAAFFERFGLAKSQDLLTYLLRRDDILNGARKPPGKLVRVAEIALGRGDIMIRSGDASRWMAEVEEVKRIYNQAWVGNWGFVPLSDEEFHKAAADLKRLVDPRLVIFAEVGRATVGFSLAIMDLNQVLAHLGGRLLPLGWLKALRYSRRVSGCRLLLFGVLGLYRGRGIETLLFAETIKAALALGHATMELAWVLESNDPVQRIFGRFPEEPGLRVHRRYRIYEMPL